MHIEIFSVYIQTMWISLSRSDLHHTFVRLYFDSLVCPHSFESKKNKVELDLAIILGGKNEFRFLCSSLCCKVGSDMGLLHSLTWFIMVAPVCCRLFRTDRSKLVEVFWIQIFRCSDYKVVAVLTDMDIEFIFKIQFCVVIFYSLQSQLVGSVMLCNLIVLQRTDLKMPLLLLKHNTFLHIVLLGG